MSSIANAAKYTIVFKFFETDMIEKNQIAAGNNLFKPILQKYGDRLEECYSDQWKLFVAITQCFNADGEQLYQDFRKVLQETGLFRQDGLLVEPQLFEWAVFEETEQGLKESSKHRSPTLELFYRYKRTIFI